MRRRIRAAAEDAVRATQEETSVLAALSTLENHSFALRDMHAGKKRKERFTMPELTDWFSEFIHPDWQDDGEYCFEHALPSLHRHLGPFARGEFGVIAGYSSDGKSVYGLQMAERAAMQGHKVGYYSLEMPERQIYRRLASMAGVPLGVIKHRTWDERQRELLKSRAIEIKAWDMDVWSTSVTLEQIRADQMRYGYDMIIIDHLHRMAGSEDRITLEKYVRSCKTLALDANCAVVALAQLSRREGFPAPTTNQLRGTDVLTQEPDWCVFVYRERDEDGNRLMTGRAIIGKARDGDADHDFAIRLDAKQMRFVEPNDLSLTRRENADIITVDSPQTIAMMLGVAK
jgi:replicative DNA helicase